MLLAPQAAEACFTVAAPVNSDARTTQTDDLAPAVATDGKGTWIVVWSAAGPKAVNAQGDDARLPRGTNQDIYFARSEDGGQTWSAKAALKPALAVDDGDDLEPSIATDGQGNWMVAWCSRDTLGGALGYDADILVSHSADNGKTWSAPGPANGDAATDSSPSKDDISPCVKSDGYGRWLVSYTIQYVATNGSTREGIFVVTSDDAGAHWSTISKLFGRGESAPFLGIYRSRLAHDGRGNWILASASRVGGGLDIDIWLAISNNDGASWQTPFRALGDILPDTKTNGTNAWNRVEDLEPDIASDGKGTWIAAWSSKLGPLAEPSPDYDIQFARSFNNATTWTLAQPLNTNAASDGLSDDRNVRLATDGNGAWVATWETRAWGGDVDLAYAVSRDNGATWTPPRSLNAHAATDGAQEDDGGTSWSLGLATDGAGGWMAVWNSKWTMGSQLGGDWNVMSSLLSDPTKKFEQRLGVASTQLGFLEGTRYAVDVTKGGKPTTSSLEIRNDGLAPLTISEVKISGPQSADFSLAQPTALPLTVAPEARTALTVRFDPKTPQRTLGLSATLVVTSNDPISSTTAVTLTGDAVPVELSGFRAE